jgi:hypothetical protein
MTVARIAAVESKVREIGVRLIPQARDRELQADLGAVGSQRPPVDPAEGPGQVKHRTAEAARDLHQRPPPTGMGRHQKPGAARELALRAAA